jgi:nitrite reductase/ring-hydroxylating ferredoxin subunit
MPDEQDQLRPSRRIVFHGLAALGVAAALAGCATDNTGGTTPAGSGGGGGSGTKAKPGVMLAKTSAVPVGGGLILTDQKVVLTQPTSGSFKAFTAVCTHQGFIVTSVSDDLIKCDHHGSEYNAKTGGVVQGPAPTALQAVPIAVKGGEIRTA